MPNHTSNHLEISGPHEQIVECGCSHWVEEEGYLTLDCNSIIPTPALLKDIPVLAPDFAEFIKNQPKAAADIMKKPHDMKEHKLMLLLLRETGILELLNASVPLSGDALQEELLSGARLLECVRKYGMHNEMEFARHMWGTKWGAYDGSMSITDESIYADFSSAWSAPVPVIMELASLYPELKFTYHYLDEGFAFGCTDEYENGALVSSEDHDDVEAFAKREFGHEPDEE